MSPPKTLLIVEDQRLIAADLEKTLSKFGYNVVGSVASGEEAVSRVLELGPDLVLMDIRLRGRMDGIQAAAAIRASLDIPIVYLTAYADEETILRARSTAPYGYVVKPFNERELRAAIEVALYKHETERLLADARARARAAEEFKLFVQGVEDYAIFMLDCSGRVATWNEGAARIKGYRGEEIVGKHFSIFYRPEDVRNGKPDEVLDRARREGRAAFEGWRVRKDGSLFWAHVVVTTIRDEAGHIHGFGEIIRDLTAQKSAGDRIRQSEERFRLLVEGVRDYAIIMLDLSGHIATWNLGAERLYGYGPDEIVGHHFSRFYTPDAISARHPDRELEVAMREGRYTEEGWRLRKDGTRFWADVTLTALREGDNLAGFAKVTRDLTDRKRRDDALRGSEEKLEALVEASRLLAESLDYRATLAALSKVLVPKLADWYAVDLLDGDEIQQVAVAHIDPEKVALARELRKRYPLRRDAPDGVAKVLRTGTSELYAHIPDELLRDGAESEEHYQIVRALGIKSAMVVPLGTRGRVLGTLTLVAETDGRYTQTDLIFAEELARRAAVAVENAKLYEEAQQAVARAHGAIAARDEFFQIASHELKTPLTPLQLQLDGLDRALAKSEIKDRRLAEKVQTATRQTARLTGLIERLLDVSRITAGHVVLDLEEVELAPLLREVAGRFREQAKSVGVDVTLHLEDDLCGRWDRLRVEQILSNLLSNAIKYGQGQPVDVAACRLGDEIHLSVVDRGIGIDEQSLQRIFGRFERAVPMRHFGGLGLGLFIARHFAEAHGGTISVRSQPNQGSTFEVVLPVDATAKVSSAERPMEQAS